MMGVDWVTDLDPQAINDSSVSHEAKPNVFKSCNSWLSPPAVIPTLLPPLQQLNPLP